MVARARNEDYHLNGEDQNDYNSRVYADGEQETSYAPLEMIKRLSPRSC
jgi:hypothetical protein